MGLITIQQISPMQHGSGADELVIYKEINFGQ